jgi:hypothetical protein
MSTRFVLPFKMGCVAFSTLGSLDAKISPIDFIPLVFILRHAFPCFTPSLLVVHDVLHVHFYLLTLFY